MRELGLYGLHTTRRTAPLHTGSRELSHDERHVWARHIVERMAVADRVEQARGSFERRMWGDAFAGLSAAHREGQLGVEDLERLAVAAYMVGSDDACEAAWIACSGRRPMCIRASSRPGR